MSKKDDQSMVTKVAIMTPGMGDLAPFGLAISSNAHMTRTEERMFQEKRKQQLAIEHQKDKTKQALRCVGELHQQMTAVFAQDMRHHDALNEAARGKPYQPLIEEFNDYAAKLEAQHFCRIVDTGAHIIGGIVSQTTYMPDVPEPAPEKKRTGLQKWLGG
jgi:hypothetical protein